MALRSDWSQQTCPIARSLDVVGDPWVVLILRESLKGARRYEQFRRELGIADNILSKRLAVMVESGLLAKAPGADDGRAKHHYALTPAGADLMPVLNALLLWGEKHTTPTHAVPLRIRHEPCGAITRSADTCDACGQRLIPDDVSWVRTPDSDQLLHLTGPA